MTNCPKYQFPLRLFEQNSMPDALPKATETFLVSEFSDRKEYALVIIHKFASMSVLRTVHNLTSQQRHNPTIVMFRHISSLTHDLGYECITNFVRLFVVRRYPLADRR